MGELTNLEKALKNYDFVSALKDKIIHVFKTGKINYVNLFVHEEKVYASSIREDKSPIGIVVITNMNALGGKAIQSTDRVKITQVLPQSAIGEIVS